MMAKRQAQDTIEKYLSKDGWRWRIRFANGKKMGSTEAFTRKSTCTSLVNNFVKRHPNFKVVELTDKDSA